MFYVKQVSNFIKDDGTGTGERVDRYCCDSIVETETTFEGEDAIYLTLSRNRVVTERLLFCNALKKRNKTRTKIFIMNINGKTLERMSFGY